MTIKFRNANEEDGIWYYQIYGPDSVDSSVRMVPSQSAEKPQVWIDNHSVEAQALIDAGICCGAFQRREEIRNFVAANPGASQLIEFGPNELETAIENRTANQETLLLKTLSFAIRLLYAELRET